MPCVNFYIDDALSGFYLFLIGLLIGLIIILIILILCLKVRFVNQSKVSDEKFHIKTNCKIDQRKLVPNNNYFKTDTESKNNSFIFYNNFDKWKNIHQSCLDILTHIDTSNLYSVNECFIREDITNYNDLEFHYRNEEVTGQKYLYKQLLNFLIQNKLISPEEYKQYFENHERKYEATVNEFNYQCDAYLSELKIQLPKSSTDAEIQVVIAEKFPLKADQLMNDIISNQDLEVRELLQKVQFNQQLSNDDINSIFSLYLSGRRKLDDYLSDNKASMIENLAKRLQNLKNKMNEEVISENNQEAEYREREKIFLENIESTLQTISEAEKKAIMDEYRKNANNIKEQRKADLMRQKQLLAKKMENIRNQELERTFVAFDKDFVKYSNFAEKVALDQNDETMSIYQKLKTNIDEAIDEKIQTWDQTEVSQIKSYQDSFTQAVNTDMNQMEYEMLQRIYHERGLDSYDINDILAEYQHNLKTLKANMRQEKLRQIKKMQEMTNSREDKNATDINNGFVSQLEEEEKRHKIVKMAMDNQMELPLEMKNKILQDSQTNEINIRNQILSLKVRQQKQLELALAKKMCANVTSAKPVKDTSTVNMAQVDIYEEEIKKVELNKQAILLEMRDKLALETKTILAKYEDQICDIMAIYQVSHAKKLRQKKNMQLLYDNLYKEMSQPAYQQNPFATQQVLDQFKNDRLNLDKMKSSYEQEQKLQMEKRLKEKKAKIASQAGNQLKRRFTDQLMAYKESGMSDAAIQLADANLMDKMQEETEKEVSLELNKEAESFEKSKEKYEEDLDKDLLNKMKDILSRLVLITDMTTSQIADKLDEIDPNIDQETKKLIIHDIMKKSNENKKEKVLFQFQDSDRSKGKIQNDDKSSYNDIQEPDNQGQKKKKKKKRIKIREEVANTENIESDF